MVNTSSSNIIGFFTNPTYIRQSTHKSTLESDYIYQTWATQLVCANTKELSTVWAPHLREGLPPSPADVYTTIDGYHSTNYSDSSILCCSHNIANTIFWDQNRWSFKLINRCLNNCKFVVRVVGCDRSTAPWVVVQLHDAGSCYVGNGSWDSKEFLGYYPRNFLCLIMSWGRLSEADISIPS